MGKPEGDPDSLIQHMIENQLDPQLRVAALREKGLDVRVTGVTTNPDVKGGFELECVRCHRKAHTPVEPPAGMKAMCPTCAREVDL